MARGATRSLVVGLAALSGGFWACVLFPALEGLEGQAPLEGPSEAPREGASDVVEPEAFDSSLVDAAQPRGCGCRDAARCVLCDDFEREAGQGSWNRRTVGEGCSADLTNEPDENRFIRFRASADAGCVSYLSHDVLEQSGPASSFDIRYRLRVGAYGSDEAQIQTFRFLPIGKYEHSVFLWTKKVDTTLIRLLDYTARVITTIAPSVWVPVHLHYERNADAGTGVVSAQIGSGMAALDTNASRGFVLTSPLELNFGIPYVEAPRSDWVVDIDDVTIEENIE